MSNAFVEVTFSQSEAALAQEATERLQLLMEEHGYVGWSFSESDLEIILIGVLSGMALSAAQVASVVPNAIFRQFGTQLLKLPFNEGASATGKTKWNVTSSGAERQIPAGTQIEAFGQGFFVETETAIPALAVEVKKVEVVAIERGTTGNKIGGEATQTNPLNYVTLVEFEGETSGGEEEESDLQYLERLANYLVLQAPRPITASNFAEMVLGIPTATLGLKIGRATAIDGYSPESAGKELGNTVIEGKTTVAKTDLKEVSTFTGVSLEKTTLPQKHPGSELHWSADGAEVYKVLARGTTMKAKLGAAEGELSIAALETKAKGKIEVIGTYENERTVTVFVAKSTGKTKAENEYTAGVKEKIEAYLNERREINFLCYVRSASYSEVQVTSQVHTLPGYTEATVKENVKTAVEEYLSPGRWGNPTGKENAWLNCTQGANVVRYNQILGVIENVTGVQYVTAGSTGLAIGLEEAPGSKTADLTLPGPAPLPFTKAANIKVTAA